MPKAVPSTTLAVLRPMPGSSTSMSMSLGTLPSYCSDQRPAAVLDALGLVAEEAGALDVLLQFVERGLGVVGGRTVLAEQVFVTRLTRCVGALGREDRGHQQFQGRAEASAQVASG